MNATDKSARPFIAVDWGTTSFRLWSMSADGDVLDHVSGPFGMSNLARDEFGGVLEKELSTLAIADDVPVVISGMAGAAQGWHEAPYVAAPTALSTLGTHAVRVPGTQRMIHILPGVKQQSPANVMRGEETQILGLLLARPNFEGAVCLPGTHSKWVHVLDGKIVSFTTCMTGELFGLMAEQSVLKHSTAGGGWDTDVFVEAVARMIKAPEAIADSLFSLRADMLLNAQSSATSTARLSGLLIGLELASTHLFWRSHPVVLIGEQSLCKKYKAALATQSVNAEIVDSVQMTLAGLTSAHKQL